MANFDFDKDITKGRWAVDKRVGIHIMTADKKEAIAEIIGEDESSVANAYHIVRLHNLNISEQSNEN